MYTQNMNDTSGIKISKTQFFKFQGFFSPVVYEFIAGLHLCECACDVVCVCVCTHI